MDSEDLPASDELTRDPFARSRRLTSRLLALPFFCAFWSFEVQLDGLIGSRGILPADALMKRAAEVVSFYELPTLAWLSSSDVALHTMTWLGMLACLPLLMDRLSRSALLVIAACYLSLINCSGAFMGYQWDVLVVEAALACVFLRTPWPSTTKSLARQNFPDPTWLLFALLVFKLMFSSGVVKISSGDSAWRNLSALTYHYWTQPLPNGLSWYAHQLPTWFHQLSTLIMFVIELMCPWLLFFAGWPRRIAALSFIMLQLLIGLTGNYGFFNLLTGILCIGLLDDPILNRVFPYPKPNVTSTAKNSNVTVFHNARRGLCVFLILLSLLDLSGTLFGFQNFLKKPLEGFRISNRYGLFAVMTRKRTEIVFEGRFMRDGVEVWIPYTFQYKPADPNTSPKTAFMHMPRLDWGLWFAALGSPAHTRYVPVVADRLRRKDEIILNLMGEIPGPKLPSDIRIMYYSYKFSTEDNHWKRTPLD